jgi:hypothetical protein
MLDWCLRWFINVWIGLLIVLQLIRAADIGFRDASSIWIGLWQTINALQIAFDPYNIVHFVVILIVASPAFGAHMWLERRKQARQAQGAVATPR